MQIMSRLKVVYMMLAVVLMLLLGTTAWAEDVSSTPVPAEEIVDVQTPSEAPRATLQPTVEPVLTSEPTKASPTRVPEPVVRFSRAFSSQHAETGDEITLSYTVRNEGSVTIRNIVVEDELVGKVGTIERLGAGERRTLIAKVTVKKACTSKPSMSYQYNGKTYSKRLAADEIRLADVEIRVELEADKSNVAPGELVTLRLRVRNQGNVNLYGLRAVEPMLGEVSGLVSVLAPGGECVVTRTVPMKSGAVFCFSVSGTSDTGAAFEVKSNEMSVVVTPVAAQIRLTLEAQADKTELDAAGEVTFSLYVDNDCSLELRNVLLSEQTQGEIRNLAFVPTGEMPPIQKTYQISESGTYRFMAQVTDSVGDQTTVYSEPIYIRVNGSQSAKVEPTQTPQASAVKDMRIPLIDGVSYRVPDDAATFEKLMTGTVLLLLVILMVWYAAARIREEKKRRRKRKKKKNKKNRDKKKKNGSKRSESGNVEE